MKTTTTRLGGALSALAAIALSALLLGLYARGGLAWPLGFVLLVPWLWALQRVRNHAQALLLGAALSVGYVLAALYWFAPAVASYTGWPLPVALAALALAAPLLQPQCIAYALVGSLAARRHGPVVTALAAASAWVASEALLPKLLGDTLGHGLQPSSLLRQSADLWGAAGLSFVLLLVNAAAFEALRRTRDTGPARAWRKPLILALALPLALALYGLWRSHDLALDPPAEAARLRVAMVQSNLTRYEELRREIGAYAVVRRVLDTHYALSDRAIAEQRADALLWSETVYPTPFGHPRSADGAELDREIEAYARSRGVPLVFGTYDIDGAGEYNAAAFLDPERGLLGYYRKTHPFPLTEHVPGWLDGEALRRALPWAGTWQAGHGPRVMPLRTSDGREVNVLPLICLDAVHPQLGIDGARLGAQAIVGLSNDAWFTQWPQGAALHLAVASFRSIETRLPQLRVTTNGISAVIDARGEIVARTAMGEAAVLVGELAAHDPPPTLMLRLGDWVGPAGLLFLALLAGHALWHTLAARCPRAADASIEQQLATHGLPVLVLGRFARALMWQAQCLLALGLAWMAFRMLAIDDLQVASLRPLLHFAFTVAAPAFALGALQRAFSGRAFLHEGRLSIDAGTRHIELPLAALAAAQTWRLPMPGPGLRLRTHAGESLHLALPSPSGFIAALAREGAPLPQQSGPPSLLQAWAEQRQRGRHRWLDAAWLKLGLFPLLPALVAFHLHQVIAFGGPFGEWLTFGFGAWFKALLLWWASWVLGLCLFAAALRLLAEAVALASLLLQGLVAGPAAGTPASPGRGSGRDSAAPALRRGIEWSLRAIHYLGVPLWLLLRVL
ncbi:apolipoprotein N-acyltransferase [Aquimonas voraii]|uniref:Apolipoprotein N-acyltransferase n=1 Tax=Aquimonas voraii TaxID=265719 RepID=A0A1G6ST64_9GAMM|nr:apolipoprotein N-acyltransferase [Aquimonas voraii]SDD19979.1 apolipoprotein N-acyltransferase [Aquimonas voraii]